MKRTRVPGRMQPNTETMILRGVM